MMDRDNLTHALPCAFRLLLQGTNTVDLLSAGDEMAEIDDAGTIGVRSKWVALTPVFQVNRPLTKHDSRQWAVVSFERLAAREGFRPNEIWRISPDALVSVKVRAQLEVTQTLKPFLHLCQGLPHYQPARPIARLRRHFGEQYWLESEYRLNEIPAAVWVSGQASREHPHGVEKEVFPAHPDEDLTKYFDVFFRDGADPMLEPHPGLISEPLPRPKGNGTYRFFLRWPDRDEDLVLTEPVRGHREPTSRFVATLDARGWLTVNRGYPPYWKATSLEAVQENAGAVFRVRMERSRERFSESR